MRTFGDLMDGTDAVPFGSACRARSVGGSGRKEAFGSNRERTSGAVYQQSRLRTDPPGLLEDDLRKTSRAQPIKLQKAQCTQLWISISLHPG